VREFAEHYGRSPEGIGAEELRHYQVHLLQHRKLAPSTVEGRISALHFLSQLAIFLVVFVLGARIADRTAQLG
jgi:hypothetical protein